MGRQRIDNGLRDGVSTGVLESERRKACGRGDLMGFWESAAPEAVYAALVNTFSAEQQARDAEMNRYADYRDGRLSAVLKYFVRRKRETQQRFDDRPKLSVPLCRAIVDVHAEALAQQINVAIDDDSAAEWWRQIEVANALDAYWLRVAQTLGTYGYAFVRPVFHDDGTPQKSIEFDTFTPLEARVLTESPSAGRSRKRFQAVAISTGYSTENGQAVPWPATNLIDISVKNRVEFISADRWYVWLDGRIAPRSPWGQVWMPTEDGTNPYGFIPGALFNGLETEESFFGQSDLVQAVYDNQAVNDLWSDIVYMHRMYVPTGVLKSDHPNTITNFKSGIGAGVYLNTGDSFDYASADVNFSAAMEPLSVALDVLLSNAKVPAVSIGLGTLFGSKAKSVNIVSGVAKAFEWKPTVRHAMLKRKPLAGAVKDLIRSTFRMASTAPPFGQGVSIDPDVGIDISFPGSIIPEASSERLDRIAREVLAGMRSIYSGMIDYHGWSSERAALELDRIAALQRAAFTDLGHGDIMAIVEARQNEGAASTAALKAGASKLFAPVEAMKSDGQTVA